MISIDDFKKIRTERHLIVLDTEKNKNSINSASIPVEDKNAA